MSLGLEFNISAKDQASAAVETVNKKIKDFGKDVAKSFLSFAAPLTLMQTGFSAIGDAIEDYNKRIQESIDNGSKLKDEAADLGVSVEVWQRLKGAADESGIAVGKVGKLYQEAVKMIEEGKDPLSDAGKILRDALGFAAEDVAKGNIEAIAVIERMGTAISGATSEADAMKIATALLGETMAKELLPALREAAKIKEGFVNTEGLTDQEAAVLRQAKAEERRTKAREEYNDAKQAVARKFLESDPEGRDLAAREKNVSSAAKLTSIDFWSLSRSEDVQDKISAILKRRAADQKTADNSANVAAAERVKLADEARKAEEEAQDAANKAITEAMEIAEKDKGKTETEADKKAADKKAKDKKDLADALDAQAKLDAENAAGTGKLTVSSLRDIGGGLAGEAMVNALDIQQKQLDISQSILIELQKLNIKTLPEAPASIDFTKGGINQTTFNA
jgi:F0F1-type ATP synthase membrane subunit b/b'